jgi:hypothetical protein
MQAHVPPEDDLVLRIVSIWCAHGETVEMRGSVPVQSARVQEKRGTHVGIGARRTC